MVEARVTRRPFPRAWTLAAVAAMGLSSIGCTMCPDPFDYSGPVPNGSSPQNDFRARSNGILPLGAAPRPWPSIVKDGTNPQENDEPAPGLADESDADALQQTVAVMGDSEEDSGASNEATVAQAEVAPQSALEPVPALAERAESPPPAVGAPAVEPVPRVSEGPVLPPVPAGETPGWRSRRR